jgi:hypothetical protein
MTRYPQRAAGNTFTPEFIRCNPEERCSLQHFHEDRTVAETQRYRAI